MCRLGQQRRAMVCLESLEPFYVGNASEERRTFPGKTI
jgi:hypothetical protein